MKLTKKRRIEIIKEALRRIEEGESMCICPAIGHQFKEYESDIEIPIKLFPELLEYRPKNIKDCYSILPWWDISTGKEIRLNVLNEILKEIS